eukprot:TRINITY_DN147_c0_g1_i1.p1 TRINITY_DN147_c0_g1~~TRINITY_DN147_c0_g1_i1.p1  ORF type:complete len:755 (+),score=175.89 TRINITY_DN147_c0_g1_i1:49-2313(+)
MYTIRAPPRWHTQSSSHNRPTNRIRPVNQRSTYSGLTSIPRRDYWAETLVNRGKDFVRLATPSGWSHFPGMGESGSEPPKSPETRSDSSKKETPSEKKSSPSKKPKERETSSGPSPLWPLATTGLLLYMLMKTPSAITDAGLDLQTFLKAAVQPGQISSVTVTLDGDVSIVHPTLGNGAPAKSFLIGSPQNFERYLHAPELLEQGNAIPIKYDDPSKSGNIWGTFFSAGLLLLMSAAFVRFISGTFGMIQSGTKGMTSKGSGIFGIGKSRAKLFKKEEGVGVTFKDVAGLPEAKQEIMEFVEFLKNPKKFLDVGAHIPKGALLTGPPGTGKTLLARATAGEAGVPFFSTSGSDFLELYVGVGPSRVKDLFQKARENAPCILFIDEIDAVGKARSTSGFRNEERENTLNQILVEMDGFKTADGIVVLAGTNMPNVLDKALLRPGRFDRQIAIDNPDLKSREEIFSVHLKPLTLASPDDLPKFAEKLSHLTAGFSGADVSNTCNEAALNAARRNADHVEYSDFESAIDRIVGGLEKKNRVMSPQDKEMVAYHEAGHAIASWFFKYAPPLLKVSIIPRGKGLGYSQSKEGDKYIITKEELLDTMSVAFGGRAAEELIYNTVTTGSADDLRKITRMAFGQVRSYGMDSKIGPLSFKKNKYGPREYSDKTTGAMEDEVRELTNIAYQRTVELLKEKSKELKSLAELLLKKEVVQASEIEDVLGPRPIVDDPIFASDKPAEDVAPAPPVDPPIARDPNPV